MKTFHLITLDGTAKAKVKITTELYPNQGTALDSVLPLYFRENKWKLVTKEEYDLYKPLAD